VRAVTDDGDAAASVRHAWSASDRYVPRRFVQPLQRFLATESAGGVVLMGIVAASIVAGLVGLAMLRSVAAAGTEDVEAGSDAADAAA
jgi:hypothetical protein